MASDSQILVETLLLLSASVLTVALFRRLHLPPMLAYLSVGVVVGPHGLGWIANTEDTRFLAEFGVVFLLFTVGLEFSLPRLVAMRRAVLGLGGAQVALTSALAGALAWGLFGLSVDASVVVGGVIAMSSTAIVTKLLTEQLELSAPHGINAVGILLFQDVAVLPFLVAIPVLGGHQGGVALELTAMLLKAAAIVGMMLLLGYWFLRPVLREVAASRSAELFTLAALLFALTAAGATRAAGLSMAMGGFLAGMLLGETEFRHQIESDIRPFRDVLLGLFFVTIGMELDVRALPGILVWVVALVAAIVLAKSLLVALITRLGGQPLAVAVRTGLVLAQGGEFGFALILVALAAGVLPERPTQVVLAALILSMALAPFLIARNEAIARWLFSRSVRRSHAGITRAVIESAQYLKEHAIICGYGRIGQGVARLLEQEGVEYMALDLDPVRVRDARSGGEPVSYGDATRTEILGAAGLARARVLVITFDNLRAAIKIIEQVRRDDPQLPIIVRTRDDKNLERLERAGASEVVPETLEASLMLASHLLLLLGVPTTRIIDRLKRVRATRYQMLHAFYHGQDTRAEEEGGAFRERLHTVLLSSGAAAVNRRLREMGLRQLGVVVTAVRRGGIRGEQPQPEMILRAGDALVLYGTPEQLQRAESRLLRG